MSKPIADICSLAGKALDDILYHLDPSVRFCVHVWRHDDPQNPVIGGDVSVTTNDVPNARRIMASLSLDGLDDPNAIPSKKGMN